MLAIISDINPGKHRRLDDVALELKLKVCCAAKEIANSERRILSLLPVTCVPAPMKNAVITAANLY